MILDALLATCLFAAVVALFSAPFMPGAKKNQDQ